MPDWGAQICEHLPALKRYAIRLKNGRQGADDLVQDVVERALPRQHLFQDGTNLRTWLFTMMRNTAITQARAAAIRMHESIDTPGTENFIPAVAPRAEDIVMAKRFLKVLDQLEPVEREVLLMTGDGCGHAEIAAALDCPIGTVKSRLWRTRRKAESLMEGGSSLLEIAMEGVNV